METLRDAGTLEDRGEGQGREHEPDRGEQARLAFGALVVVVLAISAAILDASSNGCSRGARIDCTVAEGRKDHLCDSAFDRTS